MNIFALAANEAPAAIPQAVGVISSFAPIILVVAVFYFIVFLPQQKREKLHRQMLKNLKKGDEVITIGGIHGRIVQANEETLILKVSIQTNLEVSRSCITHLKNKAEVKKDIDKN